jgi:hypothetical protein
MPWSTCRSHKFWREPATPDYDFDDEFFTTGPGAINDLWAWFKTDRLAALSDGANIASCTDSSDWGHTFTQGVGASQPIYRTNIRNGRAVARFDGVDDHLLFADAPAATAWTVFVAGQATDVTTKQLNYVVCQTGAGCYVGGFDPTYCQGFGQFQDVTKYRASNVEPTTWGVWCWQPQHQYRNGIEVGVSASAGTMDRIDFRALGGRPDINNLGFIGDVGEMLLYLRVLDSPEMDEVHAYLRKRWATP